MTRSWRKESSLPNSMSVQYKNARLVLDVAVGCGRSRPRLPRGYPRLAATATALLAGLGAVGGLVAHLAAVETPCAEASASAAVTTPQTSWS